MAQWVFFWDTARSKRDLVYLGVLKIQGNINDCEHRKICIGEKKQD